MKIKKCIAMLLAAVCITFVFPLSVRAAEALDAPVLQYKIVNHDKVSLEWSKVEGAESYCIYKRDDKTGEIHQKV